jgi:hypothetical protein
MDGCAAVMLDDQGSNAVVSQQHRAGHADQAAADDQDGNFDVSHYLTNSLL